MCTYNFHFFVLYLYMGCEQSRQSKSMISSAYQSDVMKFLIILHGADYNGNKVCKSNYEKLMANKKYMPGKLTIVNLKRLNYLRTPNGKLRYIIRELAIPRIVYIKLPKEGIYVKSEDFEFEYMKSQIHEIIMILAKLGASKITYDVSKNSKEMKELGAKIDIKEHMASGSAGFEMNESFSKTSSFTGELEFPMSDRSLPSVVDLSDDDNIYYLPRKIHWISMIRSRLQSHVLKDSFNYEFSKDIYVNVKVINKLKAIGVTFNYGKSSINGFRMSFSVNYHPVVKTYDSDSDSDDEEKKEEDNIDD